MDNLKYLKIALKKFKYLENYIMTCTKYFY